MPISAYHVKTATLPDQPGVEVNSNQWNSAHAITLSAVGSEVIGAFSNGGNVSFGLDGGGYITANGVGGGTINQTGPNIAASNSTITAGTVIFSNSNGMTFGLTNGTQMTASYDLTYATYPNVGFVSAATVGSSSNTLNGAYLNMPQNTIVYQGGTNLVTQSIAAQSVTMSDGNANYIVADRSASNYTVLTDAESIDYDRYFPYANVYKSSNHAHIQTAPVFANKQDKLLFNRLFDTARYSRETGLEVIAVDGSLNISINAGKVWCMFTEYDILPVTPATRQFFWYHVAGVWTAAASHTTPVLNNTQYDDGTGLQSLVAAQFGITYLYRGIENEDHLYTILGAQSYGTVEAAMAAGLIANLPPEITSHAMLIGRVIVENGTTTGYTYQSAFTDSFSGATPIINHADLQGLTVGNDHPQYFLTANTGNFFATAANTFANSTHNHGTIAFGGTNISGSFTSASSGLSISMSVAAPGGGGGAALQGSGAYTQNTGTIQFANSNNITFGLSTNVMTASFSQTADTNKAGVGYTSTTQGGSTVGVTHNTAGLSMAWPPFVTAAGAGDGNNVIGFNAVGTQASTTYIFSNSNNITFGINAGTVTMSYSNTVPYITTAMVSDAGTRFIQASAATNVTGPISFTLASNAVSISISNYITTAALSQNTSNYAGVSSGFTGGASISGSMTHNTAGLAISLSHPAWLTTAAQSSASNVSGVIAGTNATGGTATLSGNVSFSNANGVSFYTSAGNAIVGSVATNYQSQGAYLTTAMQTGSQSQLWVMGNSSGTIGGTNISGTVYSNGMSLSVAAPGAGGGAAISAAGNSQNTGTVSFDNAGGVSFGLSNNGVMTASAPAAAPSPVGISAGTVSGSYANFTFVNSNNISFGFDTGANASKLTASFSVTAPYLTTAMQSTMPMLDGWELEGNNTAGTTASDYTDQNRIYLSGGPNITLSGNSNTIVISAAAGGGGATMSGGYVNIPLWTNSTTLAVIVQSTSHVVPFLLQDNMAFDFIRLAYLGAISAASTTGATTGNTQFSCGYTKSHNLAIYSRGAGANSDTLQLVKSTQIVENFSNNISCATNSTQFSYSNRYTYPCSSGTIGFTQDYSSSAASINVNSASVTAFTGTKYIDIPFGTQLTAGRYWLMYGASSTTATQAFTSLGVRNAVTFNPYFVSQQSFSIGTLGAATSNIYMPQKALGSFTTAGGATTASFHWSKVTAAANHPMLYFQLMESN